MLKVVLIFILPLAVFADGGQYAIPAGNGVNPAAQVIAPVAGGVQQVPVAIPAAPVQAVDNQVPVVASPVTAAPAQPGNVVQVPTVQKVNVAKASGQVLPMVGGGVPVAQSVGASPSVAQVQGSDPAPSPEDVKADMTLDKIGSEMTNIMDEVLIKLEELRVSEEARMEGKLEKLSALRESIESEYAKFSRDISELEKSGDGTKNDSGPSSDIAQTLRVKFDAAVKNVSANVLKILSTKIKHDGALLAYKSIKDKIISIKNGVKNPSPEYLKLIKDVDFSADGIINSMVTNEAEVEVKLKGAKDEIYHMLSSNSNRNLSPELKEKALEYLNTLEEKQSLGSALIAGAKRFSSDLDPLINKLKLSISKYIAAADESNTIKLIRDASVALEKTPENVRSTENMYNLEPINNTLSKELTENATELGKTPGPQGTPADNASAQTTVETKPVTQPPENSLDNISLKDTSTYEDEKEAPKAQKSTEEGKKEGETNLKGKVDSKLDDDDLTKPDHAFITSVNSKIIVTLLLLALM